MYKTEGLCSKYYTVPPNGLNMDHSQVADPEINYEGQVGVHKSMNIIMKGEGGAQEYSTM